MLMHCIIVGNIMGLLYITDGFSSIICCYANLDLEFTYRTKPSLQRFHFYNDELSCNLLNEDVEMFRRHRVEY